jgi:hypothetical protein
VWLYFRKVFFPFRFPFKRIVVMSSFLPIRIAGAEAFLGSRKFLHLNGVLYDIRDRESDPDYSEDEEWSFEAWCGPEAAAAFQDAFQAAAPGINESPEFPTSSLPMSDAAAAAAAATKIGIHCPAGVVAGSEISKDKRHDMFGQVAGGAGSTGIEVFQRRMLAEGVGVPCVKTNMRINLRKITLDDVAHPNKLANGFDYSEDFDGLQKIGGSTVYINMKCVVGKGGAQTRSLREVYWFVEGQLKLLLAGAADPSSVFFANILDGDEAAHTMGKFRYLLAQPEYAAVRDNVYVGDLQSYFEWVSTRTTRTE